MTQELAFAYIVSHSLLRLILSKEIGKKPNDIVFYKNEYGKPFIDVQFQLHFNMSHSAEMAVFLLSRQGTVGIDIESHDKKHDFELLYPDVLTKKEQEFIHECTLSNQQKKILFLDMWTKKEAVVKAIGHGLSYPIDTIETHQTKQHGFIWFQNISFFKNHSCALASKCYEPSIEYHEFLPNVKIFL